MELALRGKVVLVTGGSKGIGLACARAFADEGAAVVIVSRDAENLRRARDVLTPAAVIATDLSDEAAARELARRVEDDVGPIEVLVNCAGAARRHPPAELDARAWHAAMDAKYFTYVHAMDAVLPRMLARRRGNIVNVIGIGGKVATSTHLPGGAANAALMLATVGLAQAHGPSGIRVNAINPGATLTGRVQDAMRLDAEEHGIDLEEAHRRACARIPLRRFALPEEVARLATFLASDLAASYITGAIVPMDGGGNASI